MGSGDWFKTIISFKKSKNGRSKQEKGSSASTKHPQRETGCFGNGSTKGNPVSPGMPEDFAATRIQTAFRAYVARKALHRLKGNVKLQMLMQGYSIKKQANTTLNYIHSWSKIQVEIRTRRLSMVMEDRIRQKKLENQIKLEAKLHDIEVDWCGGSETMEETLARIHQREEAAVKRERAMAYAFSHQWRANSSQNLGLGNYELNKANWGWSWKERWIAARPWERRVPNKSISPKKAPSRQSSKMNKKMNPPTPKISVSVRHPLSNGKGTTKPRGLSYLSTADKIVVPEGNSGTNSTVADANKQQLVA
ncbi:protein IQ-DOMAIN 1-like [Quillaja saponaria]|uniref:Protein IQ-DOMAIN 1-like n=1 Tax=Quillaja saponaria TaxID=32244 RepID=A0AAD7KXS2_QUISA|nr:protein IQ-DOMAIN 1-like [Quillaja saponaria]